MLCVAIAVYFSFYLVSYCVTIPQSIHSIMTDAGFLATTNNEAMNILIHVFHCIYIHTFLLHILNVIRSGIAGS